MPKKYTPLEKLEKWKEKNNIDLIPIKLIGTVCSLSEYFLPWIYTTGKECGLDVEKMDLSDVFNGVNEKRNGNKELLYILDEQCDVLEDDEVLIGIEFSQFNECMSLKRMKIEVFETLKNMDFFDTNEDNEADLFRYVGVVSGILAEEK